MFTSTAVLLSLAASSMANIFITNPTATTTCTGGQTCNIAWEDDNTTPTLPTWGNASVGVYVGNSQQQTMVQLISPSLSVSQTSAIEFTVDPNSGANGNFYFIRFQALSLPDPNNPQFPEEGFSAKFTMAGMTGTFNATIQSEIAGTVTAPIGGTGAAGSSTPAATPGSTTSKLVSSTTSKGTSTSSSTAKSTTTASSAGRFAVSGSVGLAGLAAAMFGLVL